MDIPLYQENETKVKVEVCWQKTLNCNVHGILDAVRNERGHVVPPVILSRAQIYLILSIASRFQNVYSVGLLSIAEITRKSISIYTL